MENASATKVLFGVILFTHVVMTFHHIVKFVAYRQKILALGLVETLLLVCKAAYTITQVISRLIVPLKLVLSRANLAFVRLTDW